MSRWIDSFFHRFESTVVDRLSCCKGLNPRLCPRCWLVTMRVFRPFLSRIPCFEIGSKRCRMALRPPTTGSDSRPLPRIENSPLFTDDRMNASINESSFVYRTNELHRIASHRIASMPRHAISLFLDDSSPVVTKDVLSHGECCVAGSVRYDMVPYYQDHRLCGIYGTYNTTYLSHPTYLAPLTTARSLEHRMC